jgi:hypothetical protein
MAKLPLTVNVAYLPSWGVKEGLRELIQNWIDEKKQSESQFKNGVPGTKIADILWDEKAGTLTLNNHFATELKTDALLIGTTSKSDGTFIGKFGEGLKFGCLALIRNGKPVTIRTQTEIWKPELSWSEKFNAECLQFDVRQRTRSTHTLGVSVVIEGLTQKHIDEIKNMFLIFRGNVPCEKYERGTILLSPVEQGNIYIRGIYVKHIDNMMYGYDLKHLEIDRDRRMVDEGEMRYEIARIISEQVAEGKTTAEKVITMMSSYKDSNGYRLSQHQNIINLVTEHLLKENSAFVKDEEEATKVRSYGLRATVVSNELHSFIMESKYYDRCNRETNLQTLKDVVNNLSKEYKKIYSLEELSDEMQQNFLWAKEKLEGIGDFSCLIVDYYEPQFLGQHRWKDGKREISIAQRILSDKYLILDTLIHERAHDKGGDGTIEHNIAMSDLWRQLVMKMDGQK